ncbi:hypothetical protein [Paenibacillus contaminans]|uniref:DUF3139 domain-containing protein n=1 Tax=Paenibacillus contaminans TaxID=450362 RepID=A0A329MS45_9BACL|nr:hypothetical protein [Paenibacillus contaminans]RAV21523.1 hypothetical protein DQG23_09655 [Paenibacillus contaminans]
MLIRKYGSKVGGTVAIIALVSAIIIFFVFWMMGKDLHKEEINKSIKLKGGTVQQIIEVKLEDSPFIETMESRIGKRNDYDNAFYKIIYEVNGVKHTAWFRGINGPFVKNRETSDIYGSVIEETSENKSLIKQYGKRWIFEEE